VNFFFNFDPFIKIEFYETNSVVYSL